MPDEEQTPNTEIDGYAAGAVACAAGSFLVPVVLAVAALFLARAYEVRRNETLTDSDAVDAPVDQRNDTLVWLARVGAWTNLALTVGIIIFFLVGIASRVIA
ncbi:MAG TPA: hypothetical protein VNB24_00955 [Acidimicrobiales bacterium]|nr:hypothetical protein [Acidimicrobiales bacterium]